MGFNSGFKGLNGLCDGMPQSKKNANKLLLNVIIIVWQLLAKTRTQNISTGTSGKKWRPFSAKLLHPYSKKKIIFMHISHLFYAIPPAIRIISRNMETWTEKFFYILLRVHLDIIPVNNQLDARFFFHVRIFSFSTCFGQLHAHNQEN